MAIIVMMVAGISYIGNKICIFEYMIVILMDCLLFQLQQNESVRPVSMTTVHFHSNSRKMATILLFK